MAFIIDEKKMIDENVFQYEEKLKSPLSRFIDSSPVFVTYYHIDQDNTTTDSGFIDVASILGFRSPIKFKKITDFPMYGIEQIVLSLQDNDQGLDTDFNGEATILPNTIKPLENDFFIIPMLKDAYLFRITEISYDTVLPDNFYKVSYMLDYLDEEKLSQLENQVDENYNCILENIGTENKCILESTFYANIKDIENMYDNMVKTYLSIFYNERYNCILGDLGIGQFLYDPYQISFINRHNLLNRKNDLQTVYLTEQTQDNMFEIKYEKSVYRFMERRNIQLIKPFSFLHYSGCSHRESAFCRWRDDSIQIVDNTTEYNLEERMYIFSEEFVQDIKEGKEIQSDFGKLIDKFIKKIPIKLEDLGENLYDELLAFNNSLEVFFFTPIIFYIIRVTIQEAIKEPK